MNEWEFVFLTSQGTRTESFLLLDDGDLRAWCMDWDVLEVRELIC